MSTIQVYVQWTTLWLHLRLGRPSLRDHRCFILIQHRKSLILPVSTVKVFVVRFDLGNAALEGILMIVIGRVIQVLIF